MMSQTLPTYTTQIGRQYVAHMSNLARVLSGELEGKGRAVKRLEISPSSPCATDGETVFLSYPIFPSITDPRENLIITEAILAHEAAGHLRYTNFNSWKRVTDQIKKGKADKLLHDFVNIFEDARVNHLLGQDFAGSKKRLDYAQALVLNTHKAKVAGRDLSDDEAPKLGVLAIATEAILGIGHYMNHPTIITMMDESRPLFAKTIASRDTSELIKGARAVLEIYRTHFPEDECDGSEYGASDDEAAEGIFADDMDETYINQSANNQKAQKQEAEKVDRKRFKDIEMPDSDNTDEGEGAGNGEGDADEADGEGKGEGEGTEGALDGETGEGDKEGGDAGEGDAGEAGEGAGEGAGGEDGEAGEDGEDGDASILGDNYEAGHMAAEGVIDGDVTFTGIDHAENLLSVAGDMIDDMADMEFDENGELVEPDFSFSGEVKEDGGHIIITQKNPKWRDEGVYGLTELSEYQKVAGDNRGGINRLAQQMKNLIKGADSRFSTHHKKGKLDTHRLYAHTTSPRIFKKDKKTPNFNLNCLIVIDASGSMSGSRARSAARAAVTLAESMEKVGANYEIVDFNSSNGAYREHSQGASYINVRKAFGESLTTQTKRQIVTPFAGSQNSDGFVIKWAISRVLAQSRMTGDDPQNMVFVISDGQPAGPSARGMTSRDHLHAVLKEAKSQPVILFSVGIDGMDTSTYYGTHGHGWATVKNSDTLAQDIVMPLKVALKQALKGGR